MKLDSVTNVFDTLVARGFVKQCTNETAVRAAMKSGPVTFYLGIDPTANSLHVGHLLPIMAAAWLQRAGHQAIVIVGGGTARIGDPSGKTELRQMLNSEQIDANTQSLISQLQQFIRFEDGTGKIIDNADWLLKWNYIDFLREIGCHFSVNRMLTMDSVKLRLERGLSFIEFNYQLLQAYDFLELNRQYGCTLQIGGDDQWGNIVAGIDLIRRIEHKESYGLTLPLITTANGSKMGKTAAGAVWLDSSRMPAFDYYQYWLNIEDGDVGRFLRLYTFLDLDRIAELENLQGADIREAKRILAWEATALVHGADLADKSALAACAMVSSESAEALPNLTVSGDSIGIIDALVGAGFCLSKSDARRHIQGGAIKINGYKADNTELVFDAESLSKGIILRFGKKRAIRVIKE